MKKGILARFCTILIAVLLLMTQINSVEILADEVTESEFNIMDSIKAQQDEKAQEMIKNLTNDASQENGREEKGVLKDSIQENSMGANSIWSFININILENKDAINVEVNNACVDVNTINNNLQIWGNSGTAWTLVKDFGYSRNNGDGNLVNKNKYVFSWNLQDIDEDNESKYQSQLKKADGTYKVYLRYKKEVCGVIQYEEKYKTFYRKDNKVNELKIVTSFDNSSEYTSSEKLSFPAVAEQYKKFYIGLITSSSQSNYYVKIIGDNGYLLEEKRKNNTIWDDVKLWRWSPTEVGTFKIGVFDEEDTMVAERNVYVNSSNNKYLQLDTLQIENNGENIRIWTKVGKDKPSGPKYDENQLLKFVVEEPYVWSRTLLEYGTPANALEKDNGNGKGNGSGNNDSMYEINEEDNGFKFNSGIYSVGAFIKGRSSLEPDDAIFTSYRKKGIEKLELTLGMNTGATAVNDKYPLNTVFTFTASAKINGENAINNENLQYAFLLYDARGKRLVQDYSSKNTYQWIPNDSGKYTIYVRVKQIDIFGDKDVDLHNSYEAEKASGEIRIHDESQFGDIKISKVYLSTNDATCKTEISNTNVISHEMYYISVDADYTNPDVDKERLMYKAYAIGDKYGSSLNNFSETNVIPFYPKKAGNYKIIVLVKDSLSGSHEARKEYSIVVKDPH